jgi:hypothetical protein
VLLVDAGLLRGQRTPGIEITLPEPISRVTLDGPVVSAHDMLQGSRIREPLVAGFPARFHIRVELWSEGGLINRPERSIEYDVLVRYIALEKVYDVELIEPDQRPFSLGKYAGIDDAERAVARPRRVPITAPATRRSMYYRVTLHAQNLQISDLDDLNRWLRGDVRPAFTGDGNPGTALTRALRAAFAKLVGGETRDYEKSSPKFRVP